MTVGLFDYTAFGNEAVVMCCIRYVHVVCPVNVIYVWSISAVLDASVIWFVVLVSFMTHFILLECLRLCNISLWSSCVDQDCHHSLPDPHYYFLIISVSSLTYVQILSNVSFDVLIYEMYVACLSNSYSSTSSHSCAWAQRLQGTNQHLLFLHF